MFVVDLLIANSIGYAKTSEEIQKSWITYQDHILELKKTRESFKLLKEMYNEYKIILK